MTTAATHLPRPLRWVRAILALVAVVHVAIPLVMLARQSTLADQIAADNPTFDADTVSASVHIALTSAAVFHAVVVVLCILIIARLPSGRPWVRRLLTVSQLLAVVFSVVSWSSSTMFHAVIPPLDVLQLAAVALAWFPLASREFFTLAVRRPQPDRLDQTAT